MPPIRLFRWPSEASTAPVALFPCLPADARPPIAERLSVDVHTSPARLPALQGFSPASGCTSVFQNGELPWSGAPRVAH
jgi:hypothetical protein